MRQESPTVLKTSEILKILANFGEVELEDVVIRAKKIVIRPLKARRAE